MTYDDLKSLKTKRHREGIIVTNDFPPTLLAGSIMELGTTRDHGRSSESSLTQRKYLIVTYVAEFDK